ncbi:MAG: DUF3820 family protein [Bacteroidota bacterium]
MDKGFNPGILKDMIVTPMPYGIYKGRMICDLPVHYLEWFQRQGFPKGKLGMLMQTVYEIKINGLDNIITQLKKQTGANG